MPRIRLRIEEELPSVPCRYRDPSNSAAGVQGFPILRLATLARIETLPDRPGTASPPITALIDTGAWVSAITTEAWEEFEERGLLEHIPFEGHETLRAAVAGRATDYRLGRVWVSLLDLQPPHRPPGTPAVIELPAVPVIAQLLLNKKCLLPFPIVLGLHLGVLDGRRLTREVIPAQPSLLSTDRGSQYAQDWHLETI